MNRNYVGSIIFSTILILSIYTIPNQIGDAYAHNDPVHGKCWDFGWNLVPDIISFTTLALQLLWLALAFASFGASTAWIVPTDVMGWVLKGVGIVAAFVMVAFCTPEIIAPPSAVAGGSHLECNDSTGFVFTEIKSDDTGNIFGGITEHTILGSSMITLPETFDVEKFTMGTFVYIFWLVGLAIDLLLAFVKAPGPKDVQKAADDLLDDRAIATLFEEIPQTSMFKAIIEVLFKTTAGKKAVLVFGVSAASAAAGQLPFFGFAIQPSSIEENPEKAISGHPLVDLDNTVVRIDGGEEKTSGTFSLGKNTLHYKTEKKVKNPLKFGNTDTDPFPINVYDNEAPTISFTNRTVILEANTHYGFKVDSRSLPLLEKGITIFDKCDPGVEPEYIGPSFFLVSSIKANQYAPWKVEDTGYDYWSLTHLDAQRSLSATNTEREPIITAQIDPNNKVEFAQAKEGSTLRHVSLNVANSEINKLIVKQLKSNLLPPTGDVVDSGELIDFITDNKISIVGVEQEVESAPPLQPPTVIDSIPQSTILGLLGLDKNFNNVKDGLLVLTGLNRATTLGTEGAEPNVFVDFKFVTVEDTIPPSIFVTEDLALEVNSTNPGSTESPIIDEDGVGCIGVGQDITCALKIEPPAIFDIADPFPTIKFNITASDPDFNVPDFTDLGDNPDLERAFPLGVSFINWKAVDFTGNGNDPDDIVTQFVNLKLNGTNVISRVFDVNATVFSTVPQKITITANNTDEDPLKFLIESNPSKGILDTPIDAVFLTKFQQLGSVAKLKGITHDGSDIFFTDSRHGRVLSINPDNENFVESFSGEQLGTPVAISFRDSGFTELTISDWSKNKIMHTTSNGTILQTFKVQGLFEKPEYLTVDRSTDEIYVTDSLNGTLSILSDSDIFSSPQGLEVDNSDAVYVIEDTNEILVFDSLGVFIESFGSSNLDSPTDLTVDSQGKVYVLETDNNSIKNFTSEHSFAIEFTSMTSVLTFFDGPEGITASGEDIFVADTQNHQVKKLTSFTPQIQEFYDDATVWTLSSSDISLQGNVARFQMVESGNGTQIDYIFQDLNQTLGDSWSAEFKIKSGNLDNSNANAFIWLLTNGIDHPQNVTSQNALGVVYDQQQLKIFQRNGGVNTTSQGISIPNGNPNFFVSFDKIGSTQAALAIFTDADRTNQVDNGNVTHTISSAISGLHVLQHANDIVNGNGTITLDVDNTFINPLLTWLGKCDSGPNCNAGSSDQFTCTDTTCFGSGAGSLDGQFDLPKGISANSTHLFVADFNNNRTQIFDISGNFISTLNVNSPTDVEYSNSSKSTVVSSENQIVTIFKNNGDTIEFGGMGSDLGDFSAISGLGIDSSGKIYVSDSDLADIQIFEQDGTFVEEWQSSITARFGNFMDRFQFYFPGMQVGAVDSHDEIVMIGDWTPQSERIVIGNSKGGNLTQHDISEITTNPHSIAFNAAEILISDPSAKKLVVVDKNNGDHLRDISALNVLDENIVPTGITINNIAQFPGEKIYVFDNGTEKIFSIGDPNVVCVDPEPVDIDGDGEFTPDDPNDLDPCIPDNSTVSCTSPEPGFDFDADDVLTPDDPNDFDPCTPDLTHLSCTDPEPVDNDGDGVLSSSDPDDNDVCIPNLPAELVFNAKDLFANLNDIAVNDTHVFGLDLSQNKSSIIQIRWDKGIQDDFSIDSVTGVAVGKGLDSELLFYTTTGNTNELSFFNRTDNTSNPLFNLTSLGITPSGIATVPNISGLVKIAINDVTDPRGIAFSPDNQTLYVSDFANNEIKVYNATTNNLIDSISDEFLSFPTDLVFGPEGNLFVASFGTNGILIVNVTNNDVKLFAGAGDFIARPAGLAVSPDGTELFVSSSLENKITRHSLVDISENVTTSFIDQDTNENVTITETFLLQSKGEFLGELVNFTNRGTLANPQDIAIGPDFNIYAASFDSDEILSWSLDGTPLGVFGQANKTESDLNGPSGILFSAESLFVSSVHQNQVLEYDGLTGQFIEILTDEATMIPDGLALTPDGNLLVSSIGSGEILEYGKLLSKFYVSDWSDNLNPIIFGLSENGTIVVTGTVMGLNDPQNIASDSAGKLWIANKGNSNLVKMSPVTNSSLATVDTSVIIEKLAPELHLINGSNPQVFADNFGNNFTSFVNNVTSSVEPEGISLDKNDILYVTDWKNHRIVKLDENKIFKGQLKVNSTFTAPMDLAINHTVPMGTNNQNDAGTLHDIWVFDANFDESNSGKLISLDPDKQFRQIEFEDEVSPLLRGLATDGTNIITTPSNSGSIFVINSNLDAHFDSKHFIIPLGIDLDSNGIYVSDWKEKRIVNLDQSGTFDREFDFKQVGFPSPELGDLEVSESGGLFWLTEPRRAVIDEIYFNGTIVKYLSIADKYVFIAGVDSDLEDNFYVLSTNDTSIKKFDLRGQLKASSQELFFPSGAGSLVDISLGPSGSDSVFVATSGTGVGDNTIRKFNATNLDEISINFLSFAPSSVAVDNDGNVYASQETLEVSKYQPSCFNPPGGACPAETFTVDSVAGKITDMVIDSNNNLYATDDTNHRVYKYNLTSTSNNLLGWLGKCDIDSDEEFCINESLHSKGFTCDDTTCSNDSIASGNNGLPSGRDNGQFFGPNALAVDGLNNIYVADVKLSSSQTGNFSGNLLDDTQNVPRVQKFSQEGFFVKGVISDLENTLVEGNFNWTKAIAFGKNNFYVADVDKLHVFDVSPFRNIKFDPSTQNTTAQVVYESLVDILGTDTFQYKSFDGFDMSTNVGTVTLNITNPDIDGDGLFGDIDLLNQNFSNAFESPDDGTSGNITDRGDQILIVREARDPDKGLYIQADIRETGDKATITLCDNLAEIDLTPGDRLVATCTFGENNIAVGVELQVLRGEVSGTFLDEVGRNSTFAIPVDNTIFFGAVLFQFISGEKNFDTITQMVHFNDATLSYTVPPDSTVQVDTKPPVFSTDNCPTVLVLETESVLGVTWNGVFNESTNLGLTGQFDRIKSFLDFKSMDEDNGNQQNTEGDPIDVTHNAPNLFQYGNSTISFETQVEFFTVDKIGNNATCTGTVLVSDTVGPILEFGNEFSQDPDGVRITNTTGSFSETGRVFWDPPTILDLPDVYQGQRLEVENSTSTCSAASGSPFKLSPIVHENATDLFTLDTWVTCTGKDLADNWNDEVFGFNVRITPHDDGLRIKEVTAADNPNLVLPDPGLSVGDTIWVTFTMPTNQPPVSNQSELDAIFILNPGNFGSNVTGAWVNPSDLLITINDISSPIDLSETNTKFDLKFNPALKSASGLLESSGTLNATNVITLGGDFSKPIPPFIAAFVASDPDLSQGQIDASGYSQDDVLTIRFSEPTNFDTGDRLQNKNKVNELFSFSHQLGKQYSGVWQNPSSLVITIDKVNNSTQGTPILGTTTATVIGEIKNQAETSNDSTSVSPPLSGNFGQFYQLMDINENGTLTTTLPSGITLGINFPNGTTVSLLDGDFISNVLIMSEILNVDSSNSTIDCEMGCDVTYWIHSSELEQFGADLDELRILHDADVDGVIAGAESLIPEIKEVAINLFSVTVKLFSFSAIALGADISKGGGGDGTAPQIESMTITEESGSFGSVFSTDIGFNNYLPLIEAKTGDRFTITLTIYENSGPQGLAHISLYMNLLGFDSQVHQSDTYIRWDKNNHWSVNDPNGYLSNTDVKVSTIGNKIEVVFSFQFAKPMKISDVIIRTWDAARNSWDSYFPDLLEVTGDILTDEQLRLLDIAEEGPLFGSGNGTTTESIFPEGFMDKWAGFSSETISDDELLMHIGLEGNYIPEWFKNTTAKWFMEEKISEQEFIDALEFLSRNLLLYPS